VILEVWCLGEVWEEGGKWCLYRLAENNRWGRAVKVVNGAGERIDFDVVNGVEGRKWQAAERLTRCGR